MRNIKYLRSVPHLFLLAIALILTVTASSQLRIPAVFSSNMILQRDKPITISGTSRPGASVMIKFGSQTKTTEATITGKWQLTLDPLIASTIPTDFIIRSDTTITFSNVLVGDVWICSGQSNMEYPLKRPGWGALPAKGTDVAMEELKLKEKPSGIRFLYIEKNLRQYPNLPTSGWFTANDTLLPLVSAIGYFFSKELSKEINVPIGIISSSWGGSRIEQWTPELAYQNSAIFKDSVKSINYTIDGMHPGQLHKAMIEPIGALPIKGVLWYQGESNCVIEDQATYPEKFRLFVNSWREQFKDPKLPFYTVQIAPHLYTGRRDPIKHNSELLPKFWEAQARCLMIPGISMTVTTDLVDNVADIHPSYKWIIAHRLFLAAMANSYGKQIEYSGPVYKSMRVKKDKIELSFHHASGLVSNDEKALSWFMIAGDDGAFVPAEATIEGDKVIVHAEQVSKPKHVRFAWKESAQPNLVNKEGLPAQPFRTDKL